jgi:aminoglycoside phosphotransferase (APT) family kinase protein
MSHLAHDEAGVREDVPHLDAAVARYDGALPLVANVAVPGLVHGDYWPENVLLGDDGLVSGIADWSGNVLAGDPRVDVAQSIMYLDMLDGFTHDDVALLLDEAGKRHGRDFPQIVEVYRLHFALVYAADCKRYDPLTYRWCVRHLCGAGAPLRPDADGGERQSSSRS